MCCQLFPGQLSKVPKVTLGAGCGLSRVSISKVSLGLAAVLLFTSALRKMLVPQTTPEPTISSLTDGNFTLYFNRSVYKALFPQLQLYRCREVIPRDKLCQGPFRAPLLLLAIKSHPDSGTRRATLRRTWAQTAEVGGFWLRPLFLLGGPSNQKQLNLVARESRVFGDILMWDFVESHYNLALKERCFLQWVHGHCQQAAFVFKGDDDLFVNPKVLTDYLRRTPNASHFIHGHIQFHSVVMRLYKYAISRDLYPLDRYPNFASGGGFVMSRRGLAALYQASLKLPVFPLDDVYLAFLALAAKIRHRHNEGFRVWGIAKDELSAYRNSVCIHGVSMERIEEVWKQLESPQKDLWTSS
ncbi:beta-1,3-galactosyltransferase 5-like [Erythrolamprus reginae]|uniref:beta-1,3-galactosyltransferase 5-like n=1 Tax=Erythrolamprus reginae TaxID=121349 RepID=UPI00396C5C36